MKFHTRPTDPALSFSNDRKVSKPLKYFYHHFNKRG
jgi:hypothetical protein